MPLNHATVYSDLTDAQYAALGRAVVEWANVEHLLGETLARLLSTPEFLARTFTDSMSAVRLQDAIAEAVEIHEVRYCNRLVSVELLNRLVATHTRLGAHCVQRIRAGRAHAIAVLVVRMDPTENALYLRIARSRISHDLLRMIEHLVGRAATALKQIHQGVIGNFLDRRARRLWPHSQLLGHFDFPFRS